MTRGRHRLAALAAALAPELAGRLLSLAAEEGASTEAARLAALPREDRLAALSAALGTGETAGPAPAPAPAPLERPRVAAALAASSASDGALPGVSPLLGRMARERCRPRRG